MVKFITRDVRSGISVGSKVVYNNTVFNVKSMYYEPNGSLTVELTRRYLDSNRPLAVPLNRVTKYLSESGRGNSSNRTRLNS